MACRIKKSVNVLFWPKTIGVYPFLATPQIVCNDLSPISLIFADFWKLLKNVYALRVKTAHLKCHLKDRLAVWTVSSRSDSATAPKPNFVNLEQKDFTPKRKRLWTSTFRFADSAVSSLTSSAAWWNFDNIIPMAYFTGPDVIFQRLSKMVHSLLLVEFTRPRVCVCRGTMMRERNSRTFS